ncbi:MAG: mechanosensitive ion channel family protein [Pelosinus sp.]|nr:mechanosensitive ion channel family protein [Pelosinus sp.]
MTELPLNIDVWLIANRFLRIAAILLGMAFILKIVHLFINRLFIPQVGNKNLYFEERRIRTMTSLLQSIIRYAIYFIGGVLILQEFRIDTTSIVAGAGIIGLALGVGAQSLIKDVITGFFIVLEDQFAVGDYISCGDMSGTVEDIGFRATKLRDFSGVLHFIPHGAITKVSNYTRGQMQAVVNIPVSYQADLAQVLKLMNTAAKEVGEEMVEVLDGPEVLGVVEFRTTELVVRIIAKTVPLEQSKVEMALRYKIKLLFEQANIEAPNVQSVKSC